jgi:hypothetical protein
MTQSMHTQNAGLGFPGAGATEVDTNENGENTMHHVENTQNAVVFGDRNFRSDNSEDDVGDHSSPETENRSEMYGFPKETKTNMKMRGLTSPTRGFS